MNFEFFLDGSSKIIFIFVLISFGIQFWNIFLGLFLKKKAGKLLYTDGSLNPELIMAGILVVMIIVQIVIHIKTGLMLWMVMLIVVLLFGIKGLIRMEIWEKGIFSKEGFWRWEDIKNYELTASEKLYNLKLKIKNRFHNLAIDFSNKNLINDLLRQNMRGKM